MVAEAVVPPSLPSNVVRNRGTRCTPGGGGTPCPLLGEMRGASFAHMARGTRYLCQRPAPACSEHPW